MGGRKGNNSNLRWSRSRGAPAGRKRPPAPRRVGPRCGAPRWGSARGERPARRLRPRRTPPPPSLPFPALPCLPSALLLPAPSLLPARPPSLPAPQLDPGGRLPALRLFFPSPGESGSADRSAGCVPGRARSLRPHSHPPGSPHPLPALSPPHLRFIPTPPAPPSSFPRTFLPLFSPFFPPLPPTP